MPAKPSAGAPEGRAPGRGRWRNLLLLIAMTGAALATAEVAIRELLGNRMVLYPRFHSKAVYGDYTLRRLRPGTTFRHTSVDGQWQFVIDAQGFRNTSDFSYSKPPGRLRVLAIGDSHTEGFEVRQEFTYSAVVERWLRQRGVDAEAINAGVSGFGTAEALALLENEGVKYHPDVVVYGLFGNDYEDNVRSGLFTLLHDTLVAASKEYAPAVGILDLINAIGPVRWLSQHSYLYSLGFNTVWDRYKSLSVSRARQEAEYTTPGSTVTEYETALLAALLARLGAFCRSRGILLVVMDIPEPLGPGMGGFRSSLRPSIRAGVQQAADVVLVSDDVLGPYRGAVELHAPHGQHHLSEFGHAIFGARLGEAILAARQACGTSGARLALCSARAASQAP